MQRFEPSKYSQLPVARPNGTADAALGLGLTAGGIALLGGIILLPTFVINPWIVKQFKPEWPYGKRLATSMVVGIGLSMVAGVLRAAAGGGTSAPAAPAAPAK